MAKQKMIRLSQCMIVKNEEENIGKALSWGKDAVWEQIVVDTGSTDRTVELAKAMGAKVFSFSWIDDFSAAKNFAISKAGGDWIAFLDADEVFAPGDEEKIIKILEQAEASGKKIDAVWVSLLDLNDLGEVSGSLSTPRIFRNLPGLEYYGRVHEYLRWTDGHTLKTVDASDKLFILHSGYQKEARGKKKGRNQKLILRELEERPDDYHMMGYLADDYLADGQQEEAAVWYQKAIDAMPKSVDSHDQRCTVTFSNLMKILGMDTKKEQTLQDIYQMAVCRFPEEPDFDYIYGCCLVQWEQFAKAKTYLDRALQKLQKLEQTGSYNRALELNGNLIHAFTDLAWCCVQTGDANRAVSLSVEVLKANPSNTRALQILLRAFRGDAFLPVVTPEQTVGFLRKICDLNSMRGRYLVLYAAKEAKYLELVRYMENMFTPEEKAELEKAGL